MHLGEVASGSISLVGGLFPMKSPQEVGAGAGLLFFYWC